MCPRLSSLAAVQARGGRNPVIRTPGPSTRRGRRRSPERGRRVRLVLTRRPRCPARGGWAELGTWVRPPGLPASRAAREGCGGGRRRHQRDGPFRLCRTPACGSERGGRALGRRPRLPSVTGRPAAARMGTVLCRLAPCVPQGDLARGLLASWPSGVGAFCAQGALGRGAQGGQRGRGCRQG